MVAIMEIQNGICELCSVQDMVVKPPQAENIIKYLTVILGNQINHSRFVEVQSLLKVCPKCLHHIVVLKHVKSNLKNCSPKGGKRCTLCQHKSNLINIVNWTSLKNLLRNTLSLQNSEYVLCLECVFYINTLESMKSELLQKYPDLAHSVESLQKSSVTTSTLKHLTPLKNSSLNLEDNIRSDTKFMNQVLYIKLPASEINNASKRRRKRKRHSESPEEVNGKHQKCSTSSDEARVQAEKRSVSPASSVSSQEENHDRQLNSSESSHSSQDENHIRKSSFFKIKLKLHPAKKSSLKNKKNPSVFSVNTELLKHNITKELRVNIVRSNFGTGSLNDILRKARLNEGGTLNNKKRKSVSFAEDKNVQIEYIDFPNSSLSRPDENCVVAKTILKKTTVLSNLTVDEQNNIETKDDFEETTPIIDEEMEISDVKQCLDKDTHNGSLSNEQSKSDHNENEDTQVLPDPTKQVQNNEESTTELKKSFADNETLDSDSGVKESSSSNQNENKDDDLKTLPDLRNPQENDESSDEVENSSVTDKEKLDSDVCEDVDVDSSKKSLEPNEQDNPENKEKEDGDKIPSENTDEISEKCDGKDSTEPKELSSDLKENSDLIDLAPNGLNGSIEHEVLEEATNLSEDVIGPDELPKEEPEVVNLVQQAELENLEATLPCVAVSANELCTPDDQSNKNSLEKEFDNMNDNDGESLSAPVVTDAPLVTDDPVVTDDLIDDQLQLDVLPEDIVDV